MGVSGQFSVDNILPIKEGEASKWQFSVDHIEASFVTNKLTKAGFNGNIVLPVSKEVTENSSEDSESKKRMLAYDALIDPINQEYVLTVKTEDAISFDVFKAKATITENSYVELRVSEKRFKPKAVLHGNLAIKGSNSTSDPDKGTVDFKGVTFQSLVLQTEAPFLSVERMGYNGEVKFANFPVTISDIEVQAKNSKASLKFTLDINLMERGFSGNTTLSIVGDFNEERGLHRWKYNKIDVHEISVKADIAKIKFEGNVTLLEDDPTFGNGFKGNLSADFAGLVSVKADAVFGKKEFRYWFVDVLVSDLPSPTGPIPSIYVSGIGGGASYKMKATPETNNNTSSGLNYVPDEDSGLSFRAIIEASAISPSILKIMNSYAIIFNKNLGVNQITLFGEAVVLDNFDIKDMKGFLKETLKTYVSNSLGLPASPFGDKLAGFVTDIGFESINKLLPDVNKKAVFKAENIIIYDFQNLSYHGEFNTYLNVFDIVRGAGKNDRLGSAVIHLSKDEYYYYIGTPDNRVGLQYGLGNFTIKNDSYFMAGNKILDSPPPDPKVAQILGVNLESLDYMRDLNALESGRGIAFGSSFSYDTGDMTFLVFYARFQAGLGYDVMVRDYGETACHGSGQIGINGWYANGQAYAYLQGELGIKIKLLFVRKKIPIIEAGAALLMQAKLPNPAWFRGYLGGHFNLLGGLVKGRFRFKIELGEECDIVGGAPLGGLKVISDVKPDNGDTGVDVFAVPQAVFNMRINQPFELEDDEGVKTYRILLDEYKVTKEGVPIEGDLEWNENNDVANFVSFDILPPNTAINIKVAVLFQEKRGNSWVTLTHNGKPAKEIEERNFTTGDAPDYIPLTNIVYCYPVINQQYFYQNERKSGYVKLKRGQPYLFKPETDWTQSISFDKDGNSTKGSGLSYNKGDRMVNYRFPTLTNEETYTLRMLSTSPQQGGSNEADDNYTAQQTSQEGVSIEVRNKKAQTIVRESTDTELLVYEFSTSAYNRFADKIKAKNATQHFLEPHYSDVHSIQTDVETSERFETLELSGGDYTNYKPLVTTEAVLDDSYYRSAIFPLVYQGYPLEPEFTVNRDVSELGLPPKKAVDILTWYGTYLEENPTYSLLDIRIPYRYHLPLQYKQDFVDIQYKIVNKYLHNTSQYQSYIQRYNYIINGVFPSIYSGDYKVKMQYVLPGEIRGSSAIFKYNNPY